VGYIVFYQSGAGDSRVVVWVVEYGGSKEQCGYVFFLHDLFNILAWSVVAPPMRLYACKFVDVECAGEWVKSILSAMTTLAGGSKSIGFLLSVVMVVGLLTRSPKPLFLVWYVVNLGPW
jgi:hypothetical protein